MSLIKLPFLTSSLVTFLLLWSNSVSCIDEEAAKEQPCFEITKTVPLDPNGMMSATKIYYPLMSRLDLYRNAQQLLDKDWQDINEAEIYYDGCMEFTFDESGSYSIGHGFHGRMSKLAMRPLSADWSVSEYGPKGGSGGDSGVCYITLTDNTTFVFSACCANDNQMLWGVGTTVKALPKKTVQLIRDHALSLGFKKEYFAELRYDSCESANVNAEVPPADKQKKCSKQKTKENDIE